MGSACPGSVHGRCANLPWAAFVGHVPCCNQHANLDPLSDAAPQDERRLTPWGAWLPLSAAADQGHVAAARVLLRAGANPRQDEFDALSRAAASKRPTVVALLLDEASVPVDSIVHGGETAAHVAAREGSVAALRVLIARGINQSLRNDDGQTAFDVARSDEVRAVLERPPNCDCGTVESAAARGHVGCFRLCGGTGGAALARGLVAACAAGSLETILAALASGADANAPDAAGDRPLHHAARNGHVAVVDALVRAGADRAAVNRARKRALDVAKDDATRFATVPPMSIETVGVLCTNGNADVARHAYNKGIAVSETDDNGDSLLHHAARAGGADVVKFLIARNADPTLRNNSNKAAFDVAGDDTTRAVLSCACWTIRDCINAEHGWCLGKIREPAAAIIEMHRRRHLAHADLTFLISHLPAQQGLLCTIGAPSATFLQPLPTLTPAQRALLDDDDPSATAIAAAGDVNAPLTYCGSTALHAAAARDNATFARRLIAAGAHLHTTNRFGHTPAHLAAGRSAINVFIVLEDCGADIDGGAFGSSNLTPKGLLSCAALRQLPAAPNHIFDVDPDAKGSTPLHCAARDDANIDRATAVLLRGIRGIDALRDAKGCTPLHVAASSAQVATVRALMDAGSSVSAVDSTGNTPLHALAAAATEANTVFVAAIAEILLAAHPNANTQENGARELPLHLAGRCPTLVTRLLGAAGAASRNLHTAPDAFGRLPIHRAAMVAAPVATLTVLLAAHQRQQLMALDCDHRDLYHLAAMHGTAEHMNRLCSYLNKLLRPDLDGQLPIHLAAACGNAETLRALCELDETQHTTAVAVGDDALNRGMIPLAIALREGHSDAVRELLTVHERRMRDGVEESEWRAWKDPLHRRTMLHWAAFGTRRRTDRDDEHTGTQATGLECVALILGALSAEQKAAALKARDSTNGWTPEEMCGGDEEYGSAAASSLLDGPQ